MVGNGAAFSVKKVIYTRVKVVGPYVQASLYTTLLCTHSPSGYVVVYFFSGFNFF